ncbi:hypothetical protein CJ030_MR6G019626 [Morella rubra]|uniref:Thionin-like protein 2 n=1 Tax=Morella rubra TaxID=262757 RepID=A0A6A1VE03_9ROSI|nr:hypothetical protein CJ030_MR6G019626 [Morella rubra]
MEAVSTKNVAVVMMLLFAVVQDVYSAPAPASSPPAFAPNNFLCPLRCGIACSFALGIGPLGFLTCLTLCKAKCSSPTDAVYSCTESCAQSKITSLKPADAREVEGYVAFCYEDCSNKH